MNKYTISVRKDKDDFYTVRVWKNFIGFGYSHNKEKAIQDAKFDAQPNINKKETLKVDSLN